MMGAPSTQRFGGAVRANPLVRKLAPVFVWRCFGEGAETSLRGRPEQSGLPRVSLFGNERRPV